MSGWRAGWAAGVVLLLLGFFALRFISSGVEAIDDAYVSFRYARHLVEGDGLVYNPGERVQGYTNFLWVMLIAAAMAAGLPPVGTACWLGLGAGALVVCLTAIHANRHLAPGQAAAAVPAVLLVVNQGFVVWSLRGLETGLFTLLLLAAGLAYLHRPPGGALPPATAILLALATLTRPEGALVFGLTLLHLTASRAFQCRPPLERGDLRALAAYGALVGVYALWVTSYYGSPLPNTFYAKVGDPLSSLPRGWNYLWQFAGHGTGIPLLLLLFTLMRRPRTDQTRSYAMLLVAGFGLYIVGVGGDVFPAYRFLVPVLPFLYFLVGDAVAVLEAQGIAGRWLPSGGFRGRGGAASAAARWVAALGVALLLAPMALLTRHPSMAYAQREWKRGNRYTRDMRMVGRWLKEHVVPGTWIAVNPAGALPYESRLPTIDMLGLNDREIAHTPVKSLGAGRLAGHEKGNGASIFRRRPGLILVGGVMLEDPPASAGWTPHGLSERELAALPDLYAVYRREVHRMKDGRLLTVLNLKSARVDAGPDGS